MLFHNLHLRRWAFDIELVVLASRLKLTIAEVGVPWHEVEGSKLDSSKVQLAIVAVGMLRDMLCVRLCYMLGIWSIHKAAANKKEQ
jgi:dolichyl-phosphate beta-glucosyltransferase